MKCLTLRLGQEKCKMNLKHLVVPGSKKVLLKKSKVRGVKLKELPMAKATTVLATKQIPMKP